MQAAVILKEPPTRRGWGRGVRPPRTPLYAHYSFSRLKYFHLLIAPIEGFITLIGSCDNHHTLSIGSE